MLRQPQVRLANTAMNWIPEDGRDQEEDYNKTGRMTFAEDLQGTEVT